MANLEKLVKAFESLKVFQPGPTVDDPNKKKEQAVSRKDKISNCNIIADCICSNNLRNVPDFPKFLGIGMETFLVLCDDAESDVRMVADECLNRTIKTLLETNLGRLQVELYKEIKKNGASRSLRAALWRFADMCHLIRPQKCRPYVVNLLPCLARICRRPEESIQETLATAMQKICPVLMSFTNDAEVKVLLKSFLPNIKSNSASCRRTAASAMTLICQYTRKPTVFFSWLLNILLDMVVPIEPERNIYLLLGVLMTLRHMIPHLEEEQYHDQGLKGSFGVTTPETEVKVSQEQLIQIYELLLHHANHADHNVVTASLETLHQLLKHTPPTFLGILLTPGGISRTSIFLEDLQTSIRARSGSHGGRLPSVGDDVELDDMDPGSDGTSGSTDDSPPNLDELDPGDLEGDGDMMSSGVSQPDNSADDVLQEQQEKEELESEKVEFFVTTDDDYSNVEIGDVNEESQKSVMSQSSSADTLSELPGSPQPKAGLRKGVSEDQLSGNIEDTYKIDVSEAIQSNSTSQVIREGNIGSITDGDIPLVYCVRVLCSKFLLTGYPGGLVPDRQVRVSVKALALACIGSALTIFPRVFLLKVYKDSPEEGDLQDVADLLLYTGHSDPQLKGNTAVLIGNLIRSALVECRGRFDQWVKRFSGQETVNLDDLAHRLTTILEDDSSVAARQAIVSLESCLMPVLQSARCQLGLQILLSLFHVKDNPYWLVKVELLELLSQIDFKLIRYLEKESTDLLKGNHHFMGKLQLQERIVEDLVLHLLSDEDGRVRHAAAYALVRFIPQLFYAVDAPQHDPIIAKAKEYMSRHLEPIMHEWSQPPQPLVHGLVRPFTAVGCTHNGVSPTVDSSLSRIVARLVALLNKSDNRHLTYGCCHALCLLSDRYEVTQYASAWCCSPLSNREGLPRTPTKRPHNRSLSTSSAGSVTSIGSVVSCLSSMSLEDLAGGSGGGPLPVVLALVTSSSIALDLSTHQDALQLVGNLFSGGSYKALRSVEELSNIAAGSEDSHWAALSDRLLVPLADQLLSHLARLLNICTHVIEEQTPGPPQTKPSLPSLPTAPSLSPIKRKAKGIKEGDSDKTASLTVGGETKDKNKSQTKETSKEGEKDKGKKEGLGTFYNLPHYMKLYDVLKGAYSNYKISLDLSSCEKFGSLLRTALDVLSQVLEVAQLSDIGKNAEELLGYMRSTITLQATASIQCVQQLLKALFGTNLSSQWETGATSTIARKPGKASRLTSSMKPGLYHSCFTTPYTQFTQCLASAAFKASAHSEQEESSSLISWLKKRAERKIPAVLRPGSKADKTSIASYIRLFEPLVIKALKQYTVTSSLDLQRQVLLLLAQLVQLRVNYCLLDSDQIFIGFVIKQFEYIEEGQIRHSETLIPHIFHFLVLLSYEKYHSKSIIGMPKIIQLCDGIMASGQQPTTHAIPALQPIVHDLFVLRSANKADAGKDLDTQREVVVSMLLRLIHHYQVLEMVIVVLHQSHRESEDKWKRLSRQVIDMVLPLLAKQQINLDSQIALDVVHRLFESVAASVFRPVDILLKTLFAAPIDVSCVAGLQRWMCVVLSILRVLISQSKEEVVLSRLQEMDLAVNVFTDTLPARQQQSQPCLEASDDSREIGTQGPPEEVFARFLLQVVGMVSSEIWYRTVSLTAHPENYSFLCEELAHLLLYITHMFQSGLCRRVATATMSMIRQEVPAYLYPVAEINRFFRDLTAIEPTLTLQWCNILILLNFDSEPWWCEVLHTQKKYMLSSPNRPDHDIVESLATQTRCCNSEIVRQGGLILFCDYVCENLNDAEHMTWVIINHVNDLIELSHEPPVQDFISAIHRNSAASGLFIQAIHSRYENMTKPSLVKKTLHCLEAIHLSQSGTLLTLLIDKFLHTNHLAVARFCDMIACRRVEMLLAENIEESSSQLPLEDLEKLLQFMKSVGLTKRHARLMSLLTKLRNLMCPESRMTLSPEKTHPLAISTTKVTDITMNKEWFSSIVRDQCFRRSPSPRECAQLLQQLDYCSIMGIIMAKEFQLCILEECIALGVQRTRHRIALLREDDSNVLVEGAATGGGLEQLIDPLLHAAQITLFRHINNIINMLPVPHQVLVYTCEEHSSAERYREKLEDFFSDATWTGDVFQLTASLLQYLVSLPLLPWKPNVPEESVRDVGRFCVLCLEMLHWMLVRDQMPSSHQLQVALECFSVVLQNPKLEYVIGQQDQTSWVCSAIRTIHQLLSSLLVLPGEKLVILPNQDSQDDLPTASFDDFHFVIRACDQISELVHCIKCHISPYHIDTRIPAFLAAPLRNIIIGLARLPLVNSYARTPPMVWKLGWMPSPSGEMKTRLPPLPLDFMQEKDILREFIFRVNMLGWTSRQQFEETWMSLLGVLNPVTLAQDQHISPEEDIERVQTIVLAVRCITSLLVQSMAAPQAGNPSNSVCEHRPRDKPLAFLHTRCGRKLVYVRGLVEREIQAMVRQRLDQDTHHQFSCQQLSTSQGHHLFDSNLDRELGDKSYCLGQVSVESIWGLIGMLDPHQLLAESSSDTTDSNTPASSPRPAITLQSKQQVSLPLETRERPSTSGGLDIHSCLQFLLDLYGQFLSPNANPRVPLMQINETIKSVVALSDVFTEKAQFEWLLEVLVEVHRTHPAEDDLATQYLVVGVCKAAAVLGLEPNVSEKVVKLIDTCLHGTHLASKVAALYGVLYVLETGMSDITHQLVTLVTEYLTKHLATITHATITSLQHVLLMWGSTFYIIENYQEELRETDFPAKMLQLAVHIASGPEDATSLSVYLAVVRGLERLLLADVLSQQDTETLVKLAVDRLCLPSPQRALSALGLVLTCMYSGKQLDQWSPTAADPPPFPGPGHVHLASDPESLIVAMERVTVLFDRIRKGFPYEARVITRILPTFLADFFPPQDIMNKVIGEFLSSQQPHPQLMAQVVFQVFESLLQREQRALVHDWVMLSLSNFTQRTPVAMAMWSLTCFFISASTNQWLRALLPHVVGRMGKMDTVDRRLFCIAALEFRSQLTDEGQIRAFSSTFQSVAQPDSPYADLLAACSS